MTTEEIHAKIKKLAIKQEWKDEDINLMAYAFLADEEIDNKVRYFNMWLEYYKCSLFEMFLHYLEDESVDEKFLKEE